MLNQIRIYEIFDETKQSFLNRFRDHAARIMQRHGFKILAMWETVKDERPAFAYLLSWENEAEMKKCWNTFIADDEWKQIKLETQPKSGRIVGDISDHILHPVDFSSALNA